MPLVTFISMSTTFMIDRTESIVHIVWQKVEKDQIVDIHKLIKEIMGILYTIG